MFPRRLGYLWGYFNELTWGLTANGMAPPMASWRDVEDFCSSQRLPLTPWEKTVLVRLAAMRASIVSEQQAAKIKANGAQG